MSTPKACVLYRTGISKQETAGAQGMAPFKAVLRLGRKPAKMVLSPGDVSGNIDETAIYTEQARQ